MNKTLELQRLSQIPSNYLYELSIDYPSRYSSKPPLKIKIAEALKTCYNATYVRESYKFSTTTFIEALTPEVAAIILATAPTLEDFRNYLVRTCLVSIYNKSEYTRMLKATEKNYLACINLVPDLETFLRESWDKVLTYLPVQLIDEYLLSYTGLTYLDLFKKVYNHELNPTEVEMVLTFEGRSTEY